MTKEQILAIQLKLKALGYKLDADGVLGRETTGVIAQFQRDRNLKIQWPGTLGPTTLAALAMPILAQENRSVPWFDEAKRKMGLHERTHNKTLREWLKLDKKTLGDPSKLPWCGDLVETAIALTLPTEVLPTNPYLARNWSKFGKKCDLQVGAVLSFWRGSRNGTSGHVGFAAGRRNGVLYVLGGNQSDRISIAPLSDDRLLAVRWPLTYPERGITLPTMSGGAISTNEA